MKKKLIYMAASIGRRVILIVFWALVSFALLETGLRFGGFILRFSQGYKNQLSLQDKNTYRILCLGESTTQGQYPPFLEETLNRRNVGVRFRVIDEGLIGTVTTAILNKVESNIEKYHPDMIVTMMGGNDQGMHIPYEEPSSSKWVLLIRSSKVYKLARLLWLHIIRSVQESHSFTYGGKEINTQKNDEGNSWEVVFFGAANK